MASKFFTISDGNELRGFKIRLYPTKEQEELLFSLENDMRIAWNWLVKQTEETLDARKAYAIKNNLVPARPMPPDYNGLKLEESKSAKEKYIKDCSTWSKLVWDATNKLEECSFRKFTETLNHFKCKQDYQLLTKVVNWAYEKEDLRKIKPGQLLFQCLYRNFNKNILGQKRKKFRKKSDSMPLQVKSGKHFWLGNFGERRGEQFYNCQISINGIKIKGRLPGKEPTGRILEGVSLTKLADGWWASIKEEIPKRKLEESVPGTIIGIDVGLDYIVAMSPPKDLILPEDISKNIKPQIENTRGKDYVKLIAKKQKLKQPVGRLHLQASRNMKHIIYNDIIKPLSKIETIKVEKLNASIGQMGSSKQSVMRLIVALLKKRYGERIKEVDCKYTSQDCSECNFRSKETWSYEHGRIGNCPECGYSSDRDINAARNIAAKPIELLNC